MNEGWKDMAGYAGTYQISTLGRWRSTERVDARGNQRKGRDLSVDYSTGYPKILTCVNSKKKWELMHRMVYATFCGKIRDGMEIDHIDGDKKNNRIDNLRQVTPSQNVRGYQKKRSGCTSSFRGVIKVKGWGVWRASICKDGKHFQLGHFRRERDAAHAFNVAAVVFGYSPEALNSI
jgi:hypothetical protein